MNTFIHQTDLRKNCCSQQKNSKANQKIKEHQIKITDTHKEYDTNLTLKTQYQAQYQTEYHNVLDVTQLIDIERNFSKIKYKRFKLEPFSFVTLASLSRHAALRKTNIELELVTDVNMILFYEKGITGGIRNVITHQAEQSLNTFLIMMKQKSSCIKYYDFNNQYGWALSQSLPCGGFEFVEDLLMITSEFVISYDIKGSVSCTLIVDVVYPIFLQPLHRDLAFLSDY